MASCWPWRDATRALSRENPRSAACRWARGAGSAIDRAVSGGLTPLSRGRKSTGLDGGRSSIG